MRVKDSTCKRFPEVCGEIADHLDGNSLCCQLPPEHKGDHDWQQADCQVDRSSEMQKKFRSIAFEAVEPMLALSDQGARLTPLMLTQLTDRIAKLVEKVHYGFHEKLG